MGYLEDALAEATEPAHIARLQGRICEEAARTRMKAILKEHGISMSVSGCGCCDSPSVTFAYKGEEIVDQGNCSFDTKD